MHSLGLVLGELEKMMRAEYIEKRLGEAGVRVRVRRLGEAVARGAGRESCRSH